ncbi:hypothetical protein PVAND_017729 [Polypedilum vanderplanki]|uniref:Ionotropic receptor n=1 Tax=Polypedilum vanderplanki TaxID=319348 RepID=A0A9J6B8Z8_POLVA|nr:hypothetical protein PVAND_017729 [Polypedilum vanderplanki]
MFEFMTTDMRKPLPESIDDFNKMNYTIVLLESLRQYKNEELLERNDINILIANVTHFSKLYEEALEEKTSTKYAFLVSEEAHNVLNATLQKSLPMMQNDRFYKMMEIIVPKSSILFQHLDDLIIWLIPSGILEFLENVRRWYQYRPLEEDIKDPRRILSISDLEFGFVIFLVSLFLAIVVFICELRVYFLKKHFEIFIGIVAFLRVVREKLTKYHDRW